jgi:hypothetical protein
MLLHQSLKIRAGAPGEDTAILITQLVEPWALYGGAISPVDVDFSV